MKGRKVRVALPTPARKRRAARVELSITMHPSELEELVTRARARSMTLTGYIRALLASDADDVEAPSSSSTPARDRRQLSLLAEHLEETRELTPTQRAIVKQVEGLSREDLAHAVKQSVDAMTRDELAGVVEGAVSELDEDAQERVRKGLGL